MQGSHSRIRLFTVVLALVLARGIEAQIMAMIGPIPPDSLGLPPSPPFLTLWGMADPGKFVTDASIPPKGPASEVFREELRGASTPAGQAGAVEASSRTKFDVQGHVVENIDIRSGHESDTVYRYQDGRLVSMETTFPNSKKTESKAWNYWSYSASGKLIEYRRGFGAELRDHELGFTYDAKGRLLGMETRQASDDKPFCVTKISYSDADKSIEVTKRFSGTKIVDHSARYLDDQGRVIRVALSSEGRKADDEAKNIRFGYDTKGRLIEQATDAVKLSDSGAEHDLPPGTISILYDDDKHTKTTKYSLAAEGTMVVVLTEDETGATTAYSMGAGSTQITTRFECEYDSYGNWTSCVQFAEQQGRKVVKQRYRRNITYRSGK